MDRDGRRGGSQGTLSPNQPQLKLSLSVEPKKKSLTGVDMILPLHSLHKDFIETITMYYDDDNDTDVD